MVIYAGLPSVALSALPVTQDASGAYHTQLAEEFAGDPILGIVENMNLGVFQTGGRVLRRRAGGDDPADRLQRGHHRRQPAHLLDGSAPAAARPRPPDQPQVPHAGERDPDLRPDRLLRDDPGSGGVPRHALRVRRDAVLHDRPRRADRPALAPGEEQDEEDPGRRGGGGGGRLVQGAAQRPLPRRRRAAVRGDRRSRHVRGLDRRDGALLGHADRGLDLAGARVRAPMRSIAGARASRSPRRPS